MRVDLIVLTVVLAAAAGAAQPAANEWVKVSENAVGPGFSPGLVWSPELKRFVLFCGAVSHHFKGERPYDLMSFDPADRAWRNELPKGAEGRGGATGNVKDAEFKNLLADLSSELANLKLAAASLKEQIVALQEENALLKKTAQPADEEPIGRKWGCYQFRGDDGLYCPGCWDSRRKKSSTTRVTSKLRMCSVCQTPLGAG